MVVKFKKFLVLQLTTCLGNRESSHSLASYLITTAWFLKFDRKQREHVALVLVGSDSHEAEES